MRIGFRGAASEVTGSCFLVECGALRFLADCGMFQGGREALLKSHSAIDWDVSALDFVLLTHAHIDHSGLIPRLVHKGFRGPIYATPATADLLSVMLPDSAHIQERNAEREDREPLYTMSQALNSLRQLQPMPYDREFSPASGVRARLRDAGHILGSASIETWLDPEGGRKLVFSGDLGQPGRPLVRDPTPVTDADMLVMESTYGNRLHKTLEATIDELCSAITATLADRRGNVVIPAFAVRRTQEVLYLLIRLTREGRLPDLTVYVDSPLAASATAMTLKHWELLDPDVRPIFEAAMRGQSGASIRFTEGSEESARLSKVRDGAVIIAGSGMCDGGRIQYHLRDNLPRAECAVLIIGFQAQGTLGRRMVDGAERVRIFGDDVPVGAAIHTIGGLSAHADQRGLLEWLRRFHRAPQRTWLVHGEHETARTFAEAIRRELGWPVDVPAGGDAVEI